MQINQHNLTVQSTLSPSTPLSLVRAFWQRAHQRADEVAWLDLSPDLLRVIPVTWGELADRVHLLACWLTSLGIEAREHLALWATNSRPWVELLLAIHSIDGIDVPLDGRLTEGQTIDFCDKSNCRWVLTVKGDQIFALQVRDRTLHDPVLFQENTSSAPRSLSRPPPWAHWDSMLSSLSPWRLASIQWTSGTTNAPKGVMLSHLNLTSNAHGKWHAVPQGPTDVRLTVLPFAHAYARTSDLGTWLAGGGILSTVDRVDALGSAANLLRPHLINLVPYLIERLLERQEIQSISQQLGGNLRWLGCGGAALPEASFHKIAAEGISVIQGYGLTEASPVICSATPLNGRAQAVGRPIAGVQVKIEASGGEIWCRSPGVMMGYYQDAVATNQKIQHRWLKTGDVGRVSADGQLEILGRADDTIVLSTGFKVSPHLLEQRLRTAPEIGQVVVAGTGMPGLIALIFPTSNCYSTDDLLALCQKLLEKFQRHEQIQRVIALPRPLSAETQELTLKGTVRREVVIQRYLGKA